MALAYALASCLNRDKKDNLMIVESQKVDDRLQVILRLLLLSVY